MHRLLFEIELMGKTHDQNHRWVNFGTGDWSRLQVVRYSIAGPAKARGGLTNRLYHGGLYSDRQDHREALLDERTGFDERNVRRADRRGNFQACLMTAAEKPIQSGFGPASKTADVIEGLTSQGSHDCRQRLLGIITKGSTPIR